MHIRIARPDAEVLRIWLARARASPWKMRIRYVHSRPWWYYCHKNSLNRLASQLPKFIRRTRPRDFPGSSIIPSKSRTFCQTPTLMVAEQLDSSSRLKPAGCV